MYDEVNQLVTTSETSLHAALLQMEKAKQKILFIIDEDGCLIGSISDGDVRRFFANGGLLSQSLDSVVNFEVKYIGAFDDLDQAYGLMQKHCLTHVPRVDDEKRILEILGADNVNSLKNRAFSWDGLSVVIMAGGKGQRLQPFTKILPKPLVPIDDKPLVEIIMDKFALYGAKEFHLTVNFKGEMIKSYFDNTSVGYDLIYHWEEKPLGTAGSLRHIDFPEGEQVFVSNCDTILNINLSDLIGLHRKQRNDLTVVCAHQKHKVPYGVIELNENGNFFAVKEKPALNFLANTGMYLLNAEMIGLIPEGEAFDMPSLLEVASKVGKKVGIFEAHDSNWIDVGRWEEYRKVTGLFGN